MGAAGREGFGGVLLEESITEALRPGCGHRREHQKGQEGHHHGDAEAHEGLGLVSEQEA